MQHPSLQSHYEKKYAHERNSPPSDIIQSGSFPTNRLEAVVSFFPRYFRGGAVLEIGAGDGAVAQTLLSMDLGITRYTMGDISLPRLEGVQQNVDDERVQVREMDAEHISETERGKYDAVIMVALIEHLVDPLRAMQGIAQLLKPGGFVYLDTPNMAKFTRRMQLLLGRFPSTGSINEGLTTYAHAPVDLHDEGHLHYFTYRSLSLMLTERCGFSRTINLGYAMGFTPLGNRLHQRLARLWPELFSELAMVAYAS